ncbi:1-4-beta-D-glucan cellobiohydrolase CEL6C [Diplonema papillatum]|nr:1-4-beta-D-glucan cellobiohydrolase CEL6C [Diplonema papillatum]
MKNVQNLPTSFWVDSVSKIHGDGPDTLEGVLKNASSLPGPPLVSIVLQNLPHKRCDWGNSPAEICCKYPDDDDDGLGARQPCRRPEGLEDCSDGVAEYRGSFIDPVVAVLQSYPAVPVVVYFEPMSISYLVKNANNNQLRNCLLPAVADSYIEGTRYGVEQLSQKVPNATIYLDVGGLDSLLDASDIDEFGALVERTGVLPLVRGFATNVGRYAIVGSACPASISCSSNADEEECCRGCYSRFHNDQDYHNEATLVQELLKAFPDKFFVIDTSRSAIDTRISCFASCNIDNTGMGHVPSTETFLDSVDAFYWVHTPGTSDGCRPHDQSSSCFGMAPDCNGALTMPGESPHLGLWYEKHFHQLASNAVLWPNGGAPPTLAPTTAAPPTSAPPTSAPPTSAPPTSAPPTAAPSTAAPPTSAPPTSAPPTAAPSTAAPPTSAPPTSAPPTAAPSTAAPPTSAPPTSAPPTAAPSTAAPPTSAPNTLSPSIGVNPFAANWPDDTRRPNWYLNPIWEEVVGAAAEAEDNGSLRQRNMQGARYLHISFWVDSVSKIHGSATDSVEGILEDAMKDVDPPLVSLVLHNLPHRHCDHEDNGGEICCHMADGKCVRDPDAGIDPQCVSGLEAYRTSFIDPLIALLQKYPTVPLAVIVEPFSIAQMVADAPQGICASGAVRQSYTLGTQYAVVQITDKVPQATVYVDAGDGNLIRSEASLAKFRTVLQSMDILHRIRGFSTNVGRYNIIGTQCPTVAYCGSLSNAIDECCTLGCKSDEYETLFRNEAQYLLGLEVYFPDKFVVVDTGRNAIDERHLCNSNCNVEVAGFGRVPSIASQFPNLDAYLWVKPPGESDGCWAGVKGNNTACRLYDITCDAPESVPVKDTGGPKPPEFGVFNNYHFKLLADNANLHPDGGSPVPFPTTSAPDTYGPTPVPPPILPTPAPPPAPMCYYKPCLSSSHCCTGMTCYEITSFLPIGMCLKTCNHWYCDEFETPAPPTPAPRPECPGPPVANWGNCQYNPCCESPWYACYELSPWYASCQPIGYCNAWVWTCKIRTLDGYGNNNGKSNSKSNLPPPPPPSKSNSKSSSKSNTPPKSPSNGYSKSKSPSSKSWF